MAIPIRIHRRLAAIRDAVPAVAAAAGPGAGGEGSPPVETGLGASDTVERSSRWSTAQSHL